MNDRDEIKRTIPPQYVWASYLVDSLGPLQARCFVLALGEEKEPGAWSADDVVGFYHDCQTMNAVECQQMISAWKEAW